MKTKFSLTLLFVFWITFSIYAVTPETITLSNIEQTEEGCIKEFLYCDKNTNAPLNKTVYLYDASGRMLEKAMYEWNGTNGWTGIQKYTYSYDKNNKPLTPSLFKWNKKINDWTL